MNFYISGLEHFYLSFLIAVSILEDNLFLLFDIKDMYKWGHYAFYYKFHFTNLLNYVPSCIVVLFSSQFYDQRLHFFSGRAIYAYWKTEVII